MPSTDAFAALRAQIPTARRGAYLDNAATSPLPDAVRAAVVASMAQRAQAGEAFFEDAMRRADATRARIAARLAVPADGVAFMKNTGEGINHVARSMPVRRGANVVTTALEFPTNRLPWRALGRDGVELRVVPPDDDGMGVTPAALADALDDDTVAVAVSWVTFQSGYRHDIAEMARVARERDALFVVDGIQGLGALAPPAMRHVDAFACGGHKWLMAPFGVGFLWLRPALAREWQPDHVGWGGLADDDDFGPDNTQLAESARRFETGNLAFDLIAGLDAALALTADTAAVEARVLMLARRLREGLAALGGEVASPGVDGTRSGIVLWRVATPERLHARLAAAGVQVSLRAGAVRFSPHCWASEADVERALAVAARARSP